MARKKAAAGFANYGDVALNGGRGLPSDWSRNAYRASEDMRFLVGHSGGVSDAYLTDQPRKRHQFAWVDIKDEQALYRKLGKGYDFVRQGTWTINEQLWRWHDGVACLVTNRLMARDAERYYEEKEEKERQRRPLNEVADEALAQHSAGVIATGAGGQRLIPGTRPRV